LFESNVTPDSRVFFSVQFSTASNTFPTVDPATVFQNPVGHMYAVFTYTEMVMGSQFTALWLHEGNLVHYETFTWDCSACSTGGSGYTDWNPDPSEWLPGKYEVQIFSGNYWAGSGRFIVQGDAPTAVATMTPSPTLTPTLTHTPSATSTP
jgi:type VI secretion system secreted protein VgrG